VALRAYADGLCGLLAAVELLIGHRRWLARADFVDRFVRLEPGSAGVGVFAVVGWRAAVRALAAGGLACSGSEGAVLRIAASLAEGVPVDLDECLSSLDEVNVDLVVGAVLHANGRRSGGPGR
jgi:hypothetical protein